VDSARAASSPAQLVLYRATFAMPTCDQKRFSRLLHTELKGSRIKGQALGANLLKPAQNETGLGLSRQPERLNALMSMIINHIPVLQ
jgi:hypothetical protein